MDIGWFGLKSPVDFITDQIILASEGAAHDAVPEAFYVNGSGPWSAVTLEGGRIDAAHDWCQMMTGALGTQGMSFAVFGGTWTCYAFERGQHVFALESHKGEGRALLGDMGAGRQVTGLSEDVLRSYCVGHPFSDHDLNNVEGKVAKAIKAYEKFRVDEDDDFPPWALEGHKDFARQAGLQFPEPGQGHRIALPKKQRPSMWLDVMRRLDPGTDAVHRFEPASFREANPAKKWWKFW